MDLEMVRRSANGAQKLLHSSVVVHHVSVAMVAAGWFPQDLPGLPGNVMRE
jgi:hypothetical protein